MDTQNPTLVYKNIQELEQSLRQLVEKIKADSNIDRVRFMQYYGKKLIVEIYHKNKNIEKIEITNNGIDSNRFDDILENLIGEIGIYALNKAKESLKEYLKENYNIELDDANIEWYDDEYDVRYISYTLEYQQVLLKVAYYMTIEEREFVGMPIYRDFVYLIPDKYNITKIFYPF